MCILVCLSVCGSSMNSQIAFIHKVSLSLSFILHFYDVIDTYCMQNSFHSRMSLKEKIFFYFFAEQLDVMWHFLIFAFKREVKDKEEEIFILTWKEFLKIFFISQRKKINWIEKVWTNSHNDTITVCSFVLMHFHLLRVIFFCLCYAGYQKIFFYSSFRIFFSLREKTCQNWHNKKEELDYEIYAKILQSKNNFYQNILKF